VRALRWYCGRWAHCRAAGAVLERSLPLMVLTLGWDGRLTLAGGVNDAVRRDATRQNGVIQCDRARVVVFDEGLGCAGVEQTTHLRRSWQTRRS